MITAIISSFFIASPPSVLIITSNKGKLTDSMKNKNETYKLNYYDADGKRRGKTFSAPTRAKARRLAEEWLDEYMDGNTKPSMTVLVALNAYIDSKAPVLSPSTVRSYKGIVSSRFEKSPIASIEISRLTLSDVQKYINSEQLDNLSPKTIKDHYSLLRASIDAQKKYDWFDDVALPQLVKYQAHVPTDAEIKALIDYTRGQADPTLYRAILLTALAPLRRSEVCCIMDTDISGNKVTINKAMVKDESGAWVIKTTKTVASTRTIIYPKFVIDEIKGIKGRIIDCNPDALARRFERALKFAKLPHMRFHDLRVYGASIIHSLGIPSVYLRQRGGWSTNSIMEKVYIHTMEDINKVETEKINNHFLQFEAKK